MSTSGQGSDGNAFGTPIPSKTRATEVVAKPENDSRQRRGFSAQEKERILTESGACPERGQLGELLRREGIYSSQLGTWRKQRAEHGREGLTPGRPGQRPSQVTEDRRMEQLEHKLAALEKENRIQRKLLELSGKAHEILGLALPRIEESEATAESNSSKSATRSSR
jgi:transposase